jgi:glycerol-3-phosphate dehydrogenase (NAD+)
MMSGLLPIALGRQHQPYAIISGPTFAHELMAVRPAPIDQTMIAETLACRAHVQGFPTGAVVASTDLSLASEVVSLFQSHTFRRAPCALHRQFCLPCIGCFHISLFPPSRLWTSADVVGVEVAGALKNVYAIAAGAVEGLGLGTNTVALLAVRATAEMHILARSLGSTESTLAGLAGVGDLMLTCFGKASRNRGVGVRLGRGESLVTIQESMTEVAEGVATAPAALRLARDVRVPVPIIEMVAAVLEGRISPMSAMMALLCVPTGEERALADVDSSVGASVDGTPIPASASGPGT